MNLGPSKARGLPGGAGDSGRRGGLGVLGTDAEVLLSFSLGAEVLSVSMGTGSLFLERGFDGGGGGDNFLGASGVEPEAFLRFGNDFLCFILTSLKAIERVNPTRCNSQYLKKNASIKENTHR